MSFTTDGNCGAFNGDVTLVDSSVMGDSNGCSGPTNGAGGMPALDNAMLDNPRWRQEMCADASVTRGWCAVDMSLSAYLAAASS